MDPNQERMDAYLDELDAFTVEYIERCYQERKAELDAQRKRWDEQVAQWAKVDAEAEAIMAERGW